MHCHSIWVICFSFLSITTAHAYVDNTASVLWPLMSVDGANGTDGAYGKDRQNGTEGYAPIIVSI